MCGAKVNFSCVAMSILRYRSEFFFFFIIVLWDEFSSDLHFF